ncbi:hypothetical protein AB0J74_35380 [Asanoa sp. NPDC049573]|uniref:hypothetical protein n=1 Tax=Asanoa sp. NPDC049573 TaxID=3155396 RepID=UPI00343D6AF9
MMDGWVWALVAVAVVLGGVLVLLGRRRAAARIAADPRAAGQAALRGMGRDQRKLAKGTMRGKGTGEGTTFDTSWGSGSSTGGMP